MTQIQTQFSLTSVSVDQTSALPRFDCNPGRADLLRGLADFFKGLQQNLPQAPNGNGCCRPISPPVREDRCHPTGSLKVDKESGVITTPGGYKIEQLGQYEWKITGQDGKWTRIWGDPHVQESDRSGEATAWDFKRDSTFVLPDGTRINVTTKPFGKDMTVTSQLEVINGNDRVLVTDIDKGKGNVGEVTKDGLLHSRDRCGNDVIIMGCETDDWYFQGREIIGSNNGGDSFKLGPGRNLDMNQFLGQLEGFALRLMDSLYRNWPTGSGSEADESRDRIRDQIEAVNQLFRTISQLRTMDDRLAFGRGSVQC
ncbi:MAG TPA: DUF1521 domain-containing protein [Pyrinomonadaceae bacterium]|nr:DUF1521 domain-containing protein [Pyrinomonadaceae bacterium]